MKHDIQEVTGGQFRLWDTQVPKQWRQQLVVLSRSQCGGHQIIRRIQRGPFRSEGRGGGRGVHRLSNRVGEDGGKGHQRQDPVVLSRRQCDASSAQYGQFPDDGAHEAEDVAFTHQ